MPRFSLATMYAPPPPGYSLMVCRYDSTTTTSSTPIAPAIGSVSCRYAVPASARTSRISCVAYATEDSASLENTASATGLLKRWCAASRL